MTDQRTGRGLPSWLPTGQREVEQPGWELPGRVSTPQPKPPWRGLVMLPAGGGKTNAHIAVVLLASGESWFWHTFRAGTTERYHMPSGAAVTRRDYEGLCV
jgi:hypothetical protein